MGLKRRLKKESKADMVQFIAAMSGKSPREARKMLRQGKVAFCDAPYPDHDHAALSHSEFWRLTSLRMPGPLSSLLVPGERSKRRFAQGQRTQIRRSCGCFCRCALTVYFRDS